MPAKKKSTKKKKATKTEPAKKKPAPPKARKRFKAKAGPRVKPLKNPSKLQREMRRREQRVAQLTNEEREAMRSVRIYAVLEGASDSWRMVSAHHVKSTATEIASRGEKQTTHSYDLEDAVRCGRLSADEARSWLAEESRELTQDEIAEARATKLWVVWYEDQFQAGPDRDPAVPTAFYLDVQAAKGDGDVRRRPLEPSWDGYSVSEGTLYEHFCFGHLSRGGVRELLARKRPR
jgi:hypothetical protein